MNQYTSIRDQVEYGLDTIERGRETKVSLRALLYVYKSLQEFERFFRASTFPRSLRCVERFILQPNGADDLITVVYYGLLDNALPEDINKAFDGTRFEHPNHPFFFAPEEGDPWRPRRPVIDAGATWDGASPKDRVEFALESVPAERTVEVSLRSIMFVFKLFEQLNSFFHQPLHYPDLESVRRFFAGPDGAYQLTREALEEHIRPALPRDILESLDAGRFDHPESRPPTEAHEVETGQE